MYYGKIATCTYRGLCRGNCGPPILAEQFELKHSLINMMTSDQFFGLEKDNPHDHIHWFNKITSTIKYKDVPNSAIKLMLFPFSLAGTARRWLKKEPPHSILTWEDLVSKFINEFFPPSRTTNLRNEISNFQHRFDESFHEAWDRYKDLLHACPHHGFTELHQLDTFYNALNPADQNFLDYAAGGNLLERCTQDVLTIIENKSKVQNSRNKSIVSQIKSSDANSSSSSEIAKLTHAVNQQTSAVTTAMIAILKQFQATPHPASIKAVEEICVTCGGAHPYYQCLAADGNTFSEFRIIFKDTFQYFFQMNTASTWGSGPLPSNTIANPKRELKSITTRSGIILNGPSVPIPPPFINLKEDERVEETLTDQDLTEYTIKVPPPLMFKQMHINITLADALILIPKYQKMLKALLSNKEKLLEMANIPLNENYSTVILKKLPEKLRDPGKFLIPCGFSKLKCKALADLGNDDLSFDIRSDLKEIEYLLNNDPIKEIDSILEDLVDEDNLDDLNDNLTDTMPEMFTDEHALDYSSPSLYDEYDNDLFKVKSDNEYVYDDPFDSKEEKIKEYKLLIDELDLPRSSDFFPSPKYDLFLFEDFYKVDALPLTDNEDKVFNPGILIQKNLS
nr:reverse transcriptase domain-containing protein [Tanacetum cinerariifolium]